MDKTLFIPFSMTDFNNVDLDTPIINNGNVVISVKAVKEIIYMEVILDNYLKTEPHINFVISKMQFILFNLIVLNNYL